MDLADDEIDALAPDDGVLHAAVETMRGSVPISADFDRRVMAAIRAVPRPRVRWWMPLVTPRAVRLSPAGAGLLVAASVALVFLAGRWSAALAPGAAAPIAHLGTSGMTAVRFVHLAPGASQVSLVGDFNEWNPRSTPLVQQADGVWTATVPLGLGTHQYAFVIDDREWRPDPLAPIAPGDDFGRPNSLLTVGSS